MPTATRPGNPLTDRQAEMLAVIRDHVRDHGFPPSLREIGIAMDISSPNGVQAHIVALERKGYLTRAGGHRSRSLRLTGDRDDAASRLAALAAEVRIVAADLLALAAHPDCGPEARALRARLLAAVAEAERGKAHA